MLFKPTLLLICALTCLSAQARPESSQDPMASLLKDKGVITGETFEIKPTRETNLGLQLRNSAAEMVVGAMNFLDIRYRLGGNNAQEGFDCSGFTRHVFQSSRGLVLPRRAEEQARAPGLKEIKRSELQPGDLVFFNTLKRTFSHVGIYVGEGRFIHAPRTGAFVRMENMQFSYWAKRFTGARRPAADLAQKTPPVATVAQPTSIPDPLLYN
jgi:hypothetical protein